MNRLKEKQKQALLLAVAGLVIAVLAIRPPKLLEQLYFAMEKAAAFLVGLWLLLTGVTALLSPDNSGSKPVFTIDYDDQNE
ncbi:MAG TPA: hypothetical protein H9915_04990 [Candidatus Gemmiger faecigallinarum]|nr:hypothetical protein [Candidatus Gemmiger faecigallinarum]